MYCDREQGPSVRSLLQRHIRVKVMDPAEAGSIKSIAESC